MKCLYFFRYHPYTEVKNEKDLGNKGKEIAMDENPKDVEENTRILVRQKWCWKVEVDANPPTEH